MTPPDMQVPTPDFGDEDAEEGPVRVSIVPMPEGLLVQFDIDEGWHINSSQATGERANCSRGVHRPAVASGRAHLDAPTQIQAGSEVIEGYTGMAQALVPVLEIGGEGGEDGFARIFVRYQPCTDTECGLPVERVYLLPLSLRPQE